MSKKPEGGSKNNDVALNHKQKSNDTIDFGEGKRSTDTFVMSSRPAPKGPPGADETKPKHGK